MRPRVGWWGALRDRPRGRPDGRLTDVFVIATLASLPLAVAAREFVPARFGYDAELIQLIAKGLFAPTGDQSYYNVGRLYAALGMSDRPWLAAALGLLLGAVALWGALRLARGQLTLWSLALIGMYTLLLSVYLAQYSKDIWVLPIVAVALLAPAGWLGELLLCAAMVAYASNFRGYWFLVLLIYLALRAATWRRRSRRRVVAGLVAAVVGATVFAPIALGRDMQSYREITNFGRETNPDASTILVPPDLGSDAVSNSVENLLTLGGLVVPVPLAALGTPVYLLYSLGILFAWAVFGRATLVGASRLFDGGPRLPDDRTVRWSLLVLAYVTTQGFFEPDYGSYLRHLTPMLPLMIAVVLRVPGTPFLRPLPSSEGPDRELSSPRGTSRAVERL